MTVTGDLAAISGTAPTPATAPAPAPAPAPPSALGTHAHTHAPTHTYTLGSGLAMGDQADPSNSSLVGSLACLQQTQQGLSDLDAHMKNINNSMGLLASPIGVPLGKLGVGGQDSLSENFAGFSQFPNLLNLSPSPAATVTASGTPDSSSSVAYTDSSSVTALVADSGGGSARGSDHKKRAVRSPSTRVSNSGRKKPSAPATVGGRSLAGSSKLRSPTVHTYKI